MDVLQQQIRRARWCLIRNQLVTGCTWSLLASLLLVAAAILVAKWSPLDVDGHAWAVGWWAIGGVGGLVAGCLWAWARRPTSLEAALEIDRRLGLHERISSAASLPPAARTSALGQALIRDAARRAAGLEVRAVMRPDWSWRVTLPLAAGLLALVATLLPVRSGPVQAGPAAASAPTQQQVRTSLQEFKQRLARREELLASDAVPLKETRDLLAKFANTATDLMQSGAEQKPALVKLNNLSKELAELRKNGEASEKIRDQLRRLPGLRPGPGDRVSRALQAGDLARAARELRAWSEWLDREGRSASQREQIASQLQELAQALEQTLAAGTEPERSMRDLTQPVDRSQPEGDGATLASHPTQREQRPPQRATGAAQHALERPQPELAHQLQASARAARDGKAGQAAENLRHVAETLQQIQQESASVKFADALSQEVSAAKRAMSCAECGGAGCATCQDAAGAAGVLGQTTPSNRPGQGFDTDHGLDEPPTEPPGMESFLTQVTAEPRPGAAVRMSDLGGPNLPGASHESIKQEIARAFHATPHPVVQQQLPRQERAQSKEYFELLRSAP